MAQIQIPVLLIDESGREILAVLIVGLKAKKSVVAPIHVYLSETDLSEIERKLLCS